MNFVCDINHLFRMFQVDPDLPDPQTHKERYYRKNESAPYRSFSEFSDSPSEARGVRYAEYRREHLIDAQTGEKIWYWQRMGK